MGEILAAVLTDYQANGRRWVDGVEQRIRLHLGPAFGDRNAARVTDDDVRAFIVTQQAKGLSNAEINLQLAILGHAYNLARKTVTVRPEWKKLKAAPPRTGFFEAEQFQAVHAALPDYLRALLTVGYITGWRIKSELQSMQPLLLMAPLGLPFLQSPCKKGRGRPVCRGLRAPPDGRVSRLDRAPRLAQCLLERFGKNDKESRHALDETWARDPRTGCAAGDGAGAAVESRGVRARGIQ